MARKFPHAVCPWCDRMIGLQRRPLQLRWHMFKATGERPAFPCPGSDKTPDQASAEFAVAADLAG